MGNGAGTKAAVRGILAAPAPQRDFAAKIRDLPAATAGDGGPDAEPDRYDAAKTVKMEEEARRLRRQNQEAERKYVLASAVESQVAKLMGQEIAETEAFLRQASRAVADKLGLDARAVRQIFLDLWRAQRQSRSSDLAAKAEAAELTDEEREADI